MSGFLIDTNVISEIRKGARANPGVISWFSSADPESLFLSVLVAGEIRKGIEQIRSKDPRQSAALEEWLRNLQRYFAHRFLKITFDIANHWGQLSAIRPFSTTDGLLAATAVVHDLTLVTRNVEDFRDYGAKLLNPFH